MFAMTGLPVFRLHQPCGLLTRKIARANIRDVI
jgi:hypothetical protein